MEMRRKGGLIAPLTVLAFVLLVSKPAQSFVTNASWPGRALTYFVNETSFVNNLVGPGLDATGYQWWIAWSWSQWRERAGIDFDFTYGGTTNTGCNVANGISETAARVGCDPWGPAPACNSWARTFARRDPMDINIIVESDTCVYQTIGPVTPVNIQWRVQTDGITTAEKDLPGVLVHEFGHGLGMGHTTGTVMQGNAFGNGSTLSRYPFGDDIEGIQSLYPTRTGEYRRWKAYTAGSWGSETTVTTNDVITPTEAVTALTSTGYKVISTFLRPSGGRVYFSRTAYPLTGASTWTQTFVDGDAWRSPAVAGRWGGLLSNLQVAAWPLSPTTIACNGMRIARSTDAFATASFSTEAAICSAHSPALAYDYYSGRFVMIYVNQEGSGSANPELTDRLYAVTSLDGVSWTAPQNLNIYSTDAPTLACYGVSDCIMGYARASTELPFQLTRHISVNPGSGAITMGSWAGSTNILQRRPGVFMLNSAGSSLYHMAMTWTTNLTSLANGLGRIWTTTSWANPISSFSWVNTSVDSPHGPSLTGIPAGGGDVYLFYVR